MNNSKLIAALNVAAEKNQLAVFDVDTATLHVVTPGVNDWLAVSDNGGNIQINIQRGLSESPLERLQRAARDLRVAIEDERDQRKGLAAVAADEIARDFAGILEKINRYAEAARRETEAA
jgi:hypothetical protein